MSVFCMCFVSAFVVYMLWVLINCDQKSLCTADQFIINFIALLMESCSSNAVNLFDPLQFGKLHIEKLSHRPGNPIDGRVALKLLWIFLTGECRECTRALCVIAAPSPYYTCCHVDTL